MRREVPVGSRGLGSQALVAANHHGSSQRLLTWQVCGPVCSRTTNSLAFSRPPGLSLLKKHERSTTREVAAAVMAHAHSRGVSGSASCRLGDGPEAEPSSSSGREKPSGN